MDLTTLKSNKDLSGVELEKGLNRKVVGSDGRIALPARNTELPFDDSIGLWGTTSPWRRPGDVFRSLRLLALGISRDSV